MFGQDTDDSAARAIVQQAIDRLEDGYRFTWQQTTDQRALQNEAITNEAYSSYRVEGQIAANRDYDVQIAVTSGTTAESIQDTPPLVSELLSYSGVEYLTMQTAGTRYETTFPDVAPGWHNRADLLSALSDPTQKAAVEYATTFRRFKDIPYTDMISSVVEQAPETLEGVDMRVFEVQMDALAMLKLQYTSKEGQQFFEEQADALEQGESSLGYTFWIGAEDGFLYQTVLDGHYRWPYQGDGVPAGLYEIEILMKGEQRIWDHGTVAEIDLPDEVAALVKP